jgi:diaminopimelate epimerase
MTVQFTKMTGAGNDFVLIDNRNLLYMLDWGAMAKWLCDRRFGIGADGLLIIEPSDTAGFTMMYYNADGSYGGMCGNGGRCAAKFVLQQTGEQATTFMALNHQYSAESLADGTIRLHMKPAGKVRSGIALEFPNASVSLHFVDTGAPHAVAVVEEQPEQFAATLDDARVLELGKAIRHHKEFQPEGTNVDFIWRLSDSRIAMRTYERGVEGETLACGTGAVASALIASERYGMVSPVDISTRSNQMLQVGFRKTGNSFSEIELIGPAEVVFTGSFPLSGLVGRRGA